MENKMKDISKVVIKECNETHADIILKDAKEKTNDSFYECVLTKEEYDAVFKVVNKYYKILNLLYDKTTLLATLTNIEKYPELNGQAKLIKEINEVVVENKEKDW